MFFVFEGPDGGGKSTAIQGVIAHYPEVKLLDRASSSLDGPVPDLDDWVDRSVSFLHGADWSGHAVYDRHPLISELIYGPMLRGGLPGRFNDPTWLRMRVRELANRAVVVWCIPPLPAVQTAMDVAGRVDMPGVDAHIEGLHAAYVAMRAVWPGVRQYTHDYTTDPHGDHLSEMVRIHCREEH